MSKGCSHDECNECCLLAVVFEGDTPTFVGQISELIEVWPREDGSILNRKVVQ